jgi:hypothetical protein
VFNYALLSTYHFQPTCSGLMTMLSNRCRYLTIASFCWKFIIPLQAETPISGEE